MKKQILCGLLAAAALALPAEAARKVPVQVDGQTLSGPCYLENGVTYAPLRQLLDTLGGWDLRWDRNTATAAASGSQGETLTADPAADTVTLNGKTLSGVVYVEAGRTYVPLRLTVELLGGTAAWDPYFQGAAVTSASAAYDAGDLYWLSRIISAESRGEPMEGQIAVGNVVLNRVESDDFPDAIQDVIFDQVDGIQFEPVGNGTVYQDPTAGSVEAAMRVLDGEEALRGAMFFYAPALSPGTWINENRTYLTTIGCHRFYL
ncbi:MAG: cell wall hydrolase [Oscillibacter sp.]|nr:cell wall hydrolase [Oscillibacter sp.]